MWRKRRIVKLTLGAVVVLPLLTHGSLALIVHRWLAQTLPVEGARITVARDDVSVGPFAGTVSLANPRVQVAGHESPVIQASRVTLERRNWLLSWFVNGAFDLKLRATGVNQDRDWLQRRGASAEQLDLVTALGLGAGDGDIAIRLAHDPGADSVSARLDYQRGSRRTAGMRWQADDVQWSDLAGLARLRMPQVDVTTLETDYSDTTVRDHLAAAASQSRLSRTTVLRFLPAPLPLDTARNRLRDAGVAAKRLHIAPMLSGVILEDVEPVTETADPSWQVRRLAIRRLAVARAEGRPVLEQLHLDIQGARRSLSDLPGPATALLREAGYRRPTLDLTTGYQHDPETGDLTIAPVTVSGDGVGELRGKVSLKDVNAATLLDQPRATLVDAMVRNVELTYSDDGLAVALTDALARRRDASVDETRQWLRRRADESFGPLLGARAEAVLPAVRDFLGDPRTLSLSAKPDEPVAIRMLVGPVTMGRYGAIAEQLAIKASVSD